MQTKCKDCGAKSWIDTEDRVINLSMTRCGSCSYAGGLECLHARTSGNVCIDCHAKVETTVPPKETKV